MKNTNDTIKEITTLSVPIVPDTVLERFFPKNTLKINPNNGANKSSKTKFFSIKVYPFKFFNLAISIAPILLYTDTKIAKPTATSAAATAMLKNTKT